LKEILHGKLTYANVISTICLFLLLSGGAAYAASQVLPKNSVGSRQLKNGAITPAKLSTAAKAAMTGAAGPQGPRGEKGDRGEAGAKGDKGEAPAKGEKGDKGDQGETGLTGETGPAGPFTATLPSGKSQVGDWAVETTEEYGVADISFGFPLAQALSPSDVHFIDYGAQPPSGCTGDVLDPGAAPGNLCVFVGGARAFEFATSCVFEPSANDGCFQGGVGLGFGKTGAVVFAHSGEPGELMGAYGTWVVTAP
jgi:hypothetical protein